MVVCSTSESLPTCRGDRMTARRYLFFGPYSWRFGETPLPGDSFVVCRVPDGPADVNTILLGDRALTGTEYWHVRTDGMVLRQGNHAGCALTGLLVSKELARLMPGQTPAPLLVTTDAEDAIRSFAQLRTGDQDVLAIWCGQWDGQDRPPDHGERLAQMLSRGLRHIEANRHFLNNFQLYFRRFAPGIEIEHKLTITSAADIYALSLHFRNMVGRDAFSGYTWEYRDDFEQWDFDNHLYEVLSPPEEAGYISLMHHARGTTVVKRKWFTEDAVERRESKWTIVTPTVSDDEYISQRFGLASRSLGSFRRTRFDISLESAATGNIYAIMIDRCRFDRDDWPDLRQVEVEYLTSRTLRTSAADALRTELQQIVDATKAELDRLGTAYVESQLSKLTYMRQLHEATTA